MTHYLCHDCGYKTKFEPWLEQADGVVTIDECPVCGTTEDLEYL